GDAHAWHLYVIRLASDTIDRNEFIWKMASLGIGTSVHFIPLHLQPYWRDSYHLRPDDFPVAHDVYQRCVSLPIYSRMTDADVERTVKAVRRVLGA
ncbi:MAG: DegT/DnrJ/EryC1/StrS family aminotransferase, partial [Salinisphaera sp.]|nr:DegT/DnrJ/EryC1/StrS family aminotransferase [Salinisphaera sp.]